MNVECERCGGTGECFTMCDVCNGTGESRWGEPGKYSCSACRGKGELLIGCTDCEGTGEISEDAYKEVICK